MFDENQLVEMKWNNKTKNYYINLGYEFTKSGDTFLVKAKDLPKGAHQRVAVICDCCGNTCYTQYYNYIKRDDKPSYLCKSCKMKKVRRDASRNLAEEKFQRLREICKENNYTLLTDVSEYTGSYMQISYMCLKHGLQTQSLDNMLHGHECFACSYEKRGLKARYTPEQVENIVNGYNNNILLNSKDYSGVFVKNLEIQCGECGEIYVTDLDSYIRKNQTRCPHCSKSESIGEFRIRKFLEKHNVAFEQEKTFSDCKDIKTLPFDFYLSEYNLIIEFDGQHHFSNVMFNNYEMTKKHDTIKNKYCEDNNINILRIPYWDGNRIEKILAKELNL